jgi:hypothetical protein
MEFSPAANIEATNAIRLPGFLLPYRKNHARDQHRHKLVCGIEKVGLNFLWRKNIRGKLHGRDEAEPNHESRFHTLDG